MATVKTDDGTSISYKVMGDGPIDVLFVHCWGNSSFAYQEMLKGIDTRGLRLLVPDLRGSGDSDRPNTGYSIERHAKDMMAVAADAKSKRFVVVGHSMGGQIAMWMSSEGKEQVRGQVLLMPVPPSGSPLDAATTDLFRNSAGNRQSVTTIYSYGSPQMKAEIRDAMLDDAGKVAKAAVQEGFDAWTKASFVDRAKKTAVPTLVIATDDPFYTPEAQWEKTASVIPNARLAHVPGCGHWGPVERPKEIAAVLQGFLAPLR